MANKTIGELTAATTPLTGDELMHGVQDNNSRKMTVDEVRGANLKSLADLTLSQGDILFVNGDGAVERLPKGASGQVLRQNDGLTAPEWWTPPFTQSVVSSELSISAGGIVTVPHGLGVEPKLIRLVAVCVIAEGAYSAGDKIEIPAIIAPVNAGSGPQMAFDDTEIVIRFGNTAVFSIRSGSTVAYATAANWRLIVYAWA